MHITWKGTFDSAHFIPGHPKCGRLHGHTYQVAITITIDSWTSKFMALRNYPHYLIDYAEFKALISKLDHRLLVPSKHSSIVIDASSPDIFRLYNDKVHREQRFDFELPYDNVCVLPITETSSECLSEYIAYEVGKLLEKNDLADYHPLVDVLLKETAGTEAGFSYEVEG